MKRYQYSKIASSAKISVIAIIMSVSFISCYSYSHDTPEGVVDKYVQSMIDMDFEGIASCVEYADEAMAAMDAEEDEAMSNLQEVYTAAKESELIPETFYEIIDSDIRDDKGSIRVKIISRFDNGDSIREKTEEMNIPVYLHDGQWWVGNGYTKSEREMIKRGLMFMKKNGAKDLDL